MARSKRHHHPGLFYHVMLRGNDGQDIFFSDQDRYAMSFLIKDGIERYDHRIHAFCYMSNHIHLLVQVGEIPLSKIMHNIASRYSHKINWKSSKTGHLFQGRFKSILIQKEIYFTRLLRYIHMNPVRANITIHPENYFWSSHNSYMNRNKISWLTVDFGLSQFAKTREAAILLYTTYLLKEESPDGLFELRHNIKNGQILGNDDFLDTLRNNDATKLDTPLPLSAIVKAACDILNIDLDLIISNSRSIKSSFARGIISIIAHETHKIPIIEIAQFLNRDPTTISSLISRFSEKHMNSLETKVLIKKTLTKALELALVPA